MVKLTLIWFDKLIKNLIIGKHILNITNIMKKYWFVKIEQIIVEKKSIMEHDCLGVFVGRF